MLRLLALATLLLAGTACSSLRPRDFAAERPRFEPEKFFAGRTRSWGVFEAPSGEPRRRFATVADGRWIGGEFYLDQTFRYDDGSTQRRHWRLRRLDAHRYEATGNDVVGRARGEAHGNAFRWRYTVALQPGNPLSHVHLDQWMYGAPHDPRTMFTRLQIRYAGVGVAQVAETFRRDGP